MIKLNFLFGEDRHELELSARDGSNSHHYGRRANLLHCIGLEYRKPEAIGRRLDIVDQEVFIASLIFLRDTVPKKLACLV